MKEFIEKLIGRLEEEKQTNPCRNTQCKDCKYTNECWEGEKCYKVGVDNIVSIVNQFAEEYNNDFCEWEIYGNRKHAVTGHGQVKYTYEVEDWLVCPYCGKKIKIAPYQPKGE